MAFSKFLTRLFLFLSAVLLISGSAVFANPAGFMKISKGGDYLVQIGSENGAAVVEIFETASMKPVSRWKLPGTSIHTIEFSPQNPKEILLSGNKNLFVYRFDAQPPESVFLHSGSGDQSLIQAGYSPDGKNVIWATSDSIHSAELSTNEIVSNQFPGKKIKSFAPLKNSKAAVSFKKDNRIVLMNPYEKKGTARYLPKEHEHKIVGVKSPDGSQLFSLDETRKLVQWSPETEKPVKKFQLPGKKDQPAVALSLDDQKKSLLVMTGDKSGKEETKKFDLLTFEEEKLSAEKSPSYQRTESGEIYTPTNNLKSLIEDYEKTERLLNERPVKQEANYYELAKIEFDAKQYKKSLEFIDKVSIHSKDYKKARDLKQLISVIQKQNIEIQAAEGELKKGHYSSAKVLLDGVLAKDPEHPVAKKYADMIVSRQQKAIFLKWGLIILSIVLVLLLSWLAYPWLKKEWQKKPEKKKAATAVKREAQPAEKKQATPPTPEEKKNFVDALSRMKSVLQTAIAADRYRELEQNWVSLEAEMNLIVRQGKRVDADLAFLTRQLQELIGIIEGLHFRQEQEQKAKKASREAHEPHENYYDVLGVNRRATQEEIKAAYRSKMHDYHPDKHQGADYEWIRKESEKMTRKIQEAFDTLSDLKLRMEYNEKLKVQEE